MDRERRFSLLGQAVGHVRLCLLTRESPFLRAGSLTFLRSIRLLKSDFSPYRQSTAVRFSSAFSVRPARPNFPGDEWLGGRVLRRSSNTRPAAYPYKL